MSGGNVAGAPQPPSRVRLGLATGVPFGLFWGVLVALQGGPGADAGPAGYGILAGASIVAGALFGLVMALVLGHLQDRAARRTGTAGVVAQSTVRAAVSGPEVLARVGEAAALLPGGRVTAVDADRALLRTGVTWRSWGERIEIEVRPQGPASRVVLRSRPLVPFTLVDQGRNAENVARLADWVAGLP
ncbi:hypothetical protein LWC35_21605 [Pseudonocardia kujensis]|uniref:hypothetical protein n=1 Tax=Pseudonocardia kujensis TaxID=1128675 RepID=UPI001E40AF37|nr:hypothetical protein [Pseudonocardia kujensis]MCE0765478.1 hypothetical protein [Pseudonocardia kujensis]